MKCEKCGQREADFFFTATVDGKTLRRCLCTDCAREEGFDKVIDDAAGAPEAGAAEEEENWDGAVEMLGRIFGMGPYVAAPAVVWPRLQIFITAPEAEGPAEDAAAKIPEDAGAAARTERARTALKAQLETAVAAEDYERAAQLRDALRAMGE